MYSSDIVSAPATARPRRRLHVFAPLLVPALVAAPGARTTAQQVTAQQVTAQQPPAAFDLVLRGGVLIDPVARTTRPADIGIRAARIAAIGEIAAAPGTPTIELGGLHLAPGFIDVHTHVDTDVVREPLCRNFLQMGVTTIVTGNCGSSMPDLAAHFARLDKGGVGVNYASLVGHGTVRTAVMGTANRAPTADELTRMGDLVERAMQAGAFGMSTGLIYVPGTYAKREEIGALAAIVGRHGGIYTSHIRSENDAILDAIAEAIAIGEAGGVPVHVSHVKCTGKPNHGRADEVLAALRDARSRGVRVSADQYAYDASSTGLDVLFPADELAVGRAEFGKHLATDGPFRAKIEAALLAKMDQVGFGDFRYARIAAAKGNEDLNGLLIPDAAKRRLGRDDRQAQAQIVMDLLAVAAPSRVQMVYHVIAERDVERFLAEDWIAIASDARLLPEEPTDRPHPRGLGNNPRVLGHYVRDRGTLDLPTAVLKMTALPARIFGLVDRGELRIGAFADLVVFDPSTIADQATFVEPLRPPTGVTLVLVNGQIALSHGEATGVRAGAVLRHVRSDTK